VKRRGALGSIGVGAMVLALGYLLLRGPLSAGGRLSPALDAPIPTTRVQRGRVQVTVHTVGDIRAARAAQLFVPPIGGQVQIVALASAGQAVRAGDVVVAFDAAEQEFALEQARFDLRQAEQDAAKAEAQAAVLDAEDEVALLHAKYDVRRAEIDASSNELLSAIQAEQNLLLLAEARQRYAQIQQDVARHRDTNRAAGAGLIEKRNKAEVSVRVAERNIASLQIRAPFDGFVTIRTNNQAFGGMWTPSMPDFRIGDATFSGQAIADVVDTSALEVTARVSEGDRASIEAGQQVEVAVDALPEEKLRGTVRAVSGVAARQMFDAGTRQFDVAFDVSGTAAARPGITATIAIAGPTLDNVLYLPRSAIFDSIGRPIVYVRKGAGFEPQDVRVRAWTESYAVVENLEPSTEVALVNPDTAAGARPRRNPQAPPIAQRASR
jgi:HlyD family secretion protein